MGLAIKETNFTEVEKLKPKVIYESFFYSGGTLGGINRRTEGYVTEQKGGGVRGAVTWLSRQSRRNLLRTLYKVDRTDLAPHEVKFITLTHDGDTELRSKITGPEHKRQLKVFTQWLQRNYGGCGIWKFELGVGVGVGIRVGVGLSLIHI